MTRGVVTGRQTYGLLAALYAGQWIAPSFLGAGGLSAVLRDRGASLAELGILQALVLLGLAKVFWAPTVDRFGSRRRGHYRSWLLIVQPAMVVGVAVLSGLDPGPDLPVILGVVVVLWLLMGIQDIATDALAIRSVTPEGRGIAQGIQTAGGFVGTVIGAGAVLVVYDHLGWTAAIATLTVATAVPLLALLRYHEPHPNVSAPAANDRRAWWTATVALFAMPGARRWGLVVLPMLWLGTGAAFALLTPMLVDAGWSLTRIGIVDTVGGSLAAIGAALLAGPGIRRLGRRRAILAFSSAQLLAMAALTPLAFGHGPLLGTSAASWLLHATYAATVTATATVSMDYCRHDHPGSDITILSTVANAVCGSPMIGEASAIRGSDARGTEALRPGVP